MRKRLVLAPLALAPLVLGALSILVPAGPRAQEQAGTYVPETDPLVRQKLEAWQDARFGLLMHWGPYSQWSIVESWSLCDEEWVRRRIPGVSDEPAYDEYKRAYTALKTTFNPTRFDPARWARAARDAGMRYVVFTTKHHDGFCMFDTATTDYRITSPTCPFSANPKANVTREIFESFRQQGMMVGAYFSKPDWNSEYYWWPYLSTPGRHVNYNTRKFPERWERFKRFTSAQIEELMTGYGRVDILWLDGAWVRPYDNIPAEFESWARKPGSPQDIDIPAIAAMARRHQPGLIVVDRWVSGPYENYLTPENKVPEQALGVPWEACMPMATSWSYVRGDTYKPVRRLVHLLADIVAKGGNFLLNIGPSPDGEWDAAAYDRLAGIGAWMRVNGEAIHGTRPMAPYSDGKCRLTRKGDGTVYAIYLADANESAPPARLWLSHVRPAARATVTLLGAGGTLAWEPIGNGVLVQVPDAVRARPPSDHAWTLRISRVEQRKDVP